MNSLKIKFTSQRNCFAGFPGSIVQYLDQTKINIFEIIGDNGSCYLSWSGDKSNKSSTVLMSGMFGTKLGLKDQQDVIVRLVDTYSTCVRAFVEPLSVDDWEILELNSSFVESNLLNQLRVIWPGMVFPVWVQNICIYCKIGKTEPPKTLLLMENMTELVITSKNRKSPPQKPYSSIQEPDHAPTTVPVAKTPSNITSGSPAEETIEKQEICTCPDVNKNVLDQNPKDDTDKGLVGNIWHAWCSVQSWIFGVTGPSDPDLRNKQPESEVTDLQIDILFRVQPMWEKFLDLGIEKLGLNFQVCNQPTNVYVSHKTLRHMGMFSAQKQNTKTFIATVEKIQSVTEEQEEAKNQAEQKKTKEPNKYAPLDGEDNTVTKKMVVRVVVLELESRESKWKFTVADGHIMMHDILRQQLALPVGAPVRLKAVTTKDIPITDVCLQQIGTFPASTSNDRIQTAFKTWVSCVSTIESPLVLGQRTVIKALMDKEVYGTFLVNLSEKQKSDKNVAYAFLYPEYLDRINVELQKQRSTPNKQYKTYAINKVADLSEIGSGKPKLSIEELDCLKLQAEKALAYVSVCLCQRPLAGNIFHTAPGLHNGGLLICGKRGIGKTAFTKAILYELTKWPIHAYTTEINCKQLRGKRLEYIQKMLHNVFEEAASHQPSVILLEDIDIIMAAPKGPEQEYTPEAIYSLKAAELLKDEANETLRKGHLIALLATCKETSSVNSMLVNPKGHHFFQQTLQIDPPDKSTRLKILKTIMMSKVNVSHDSIPECDLDKVANATEGYVARDLDNIIERAVQAHRMHHKNQDRTIIQPEVKLTQRDLEASLNGFTPISLQDVPLHNKGNTKWGDIGGLKEVRQCLIQMLQWPSKYPALFSNCPLRIRSGVLLYGAPGTGKTLIASAVAKECGLNFISIKGPELLSKYIGASEQAVRDTFVKAQSAKPCILFFDEFDSFAPRRGHDNTGVTDRVVNQLLTQLDGVESLEGVYVMAASSRPDLIDPALLRPGRLDRAIYCPIPNETDRLDILQVLAKNVNLSADVDLKAVSEQCLNFTGADFKALLYNAQLHAIHEIETSLPNSSPKSLTGSPKIKTDWTFINGNHNDTDKLKNNETANREESLVLEKKYVSQLTYIPDLKEGPVDLSPEMEQELIDHVPKATENAEQEFVKNSLEVHQIHLHKAVQEVNPSVSESERQKYNKIYETFVSSKGGKFSDLTENAGRKATLA